MIHTSTTLGTEQPGLTLEALLEAKAKLEAMLPVQEYWLSEYAPLTRDDGEPVAMGLPVSVIEVDIFGTPSLDGPYVLVFHPDNLAHFQEKARGRIHLVERQRPNGQKDTSS